MFRKLAYEGIYSFGGVTFKNGAYTANNDMRYMKVGNGPQGWKILKIGGRPPKPRYFMSLEVFEQKNMLVVFGGRGVDEVGQKSIGMNDVWLMSLKHPQWYQLDCKGKDYKGSIGTVPNPRYSHVSGIFENKLIIFGGLSNGCFCKNDLFILQIDIQHAVKSKKTATIKLTQGAIQAFKYSLAYKRTRKERILKLMKKAGGEMLLKFRSIDKPNQKKIQKSSVFSTSKVAVIMKLSISI